MKQEISRLLTFVFIITFTKQSAIFCTFNIRKFHLAFIANYAKHAKYSKYRKSGYNFFYNNLKPEITCALIKPEIIKNNPKAIEEIIKEIELNKFEILSKRFKHLSKNEAKWLYQNIKSKPYFSEVIEYITSGPIIALALKKPNAINLWRNTIGCTDPKKANKNTIRYKYGTSREKNAVHGSDSLYHANFEIRALFPELTNILYDPKNLIEPPKIAGLLNY